MKRILYIIMCVTALLTGCTDEIDTIQGGMSEVTLTLATDAQYANNTEPMAKTRAAVTMNRYVMEIYTDEACTEQANLFDNGTTHHKQQTTADFSLKLDRSKTYYCLFWADDGNAQQGYTVFNLKSVRWWSTAQQPTMAYTGKATITNNGETLTVTLRHAAAQVVLKDLNGVEAGEKLQLSYPQPIAFNVATGDVSDLRTITLTQTTTATTAGEEVIQFYILAPREEKAEFDLKFKYADQNWQTVTSIPSQANYTTNVTGHYMTVPDQMKFTIDLTSFTDKSYILPFEKTTTGNYKLTVNWGDGSEKTVIPPNTNLSSNYGLLKHTYKNQQSYQITISSTQTDATKEQMPNFEPGYYPLYDSENKLKIKSMDSPMLHVGTTYFQRCFYGCSNLTTIPATLFEKNTQLKRLDNAFLHCTSLTTIPAGLFDKNTLVEGFASCFSSCTELTEIPDDLFKNNIAVTNFGSCFTDCAKLTKLPANLFRTNTRVINFNACFQGCSGLTTIPDDLFKENTNVTNFGYCFFGCSGLTTIPATLFQTNTVVTTFEMCFRGCSSLTELPGELFKENTQVTDFSLCFQECSGLKTLPATLFQTNTLVTNFWQCFYSCSKLETIPAALFEKNTAVLNFQSIFCGCSSLTTIPKGLFDKNELVKNFSSCFSGCRQLTTIPAGLFDKNVQVTDFNNCFFNCTGLTTIPEKLFEKNVLATNFNRCFRNCYKMTLIANIFCDEDTAKATRFANTSEAIDFSQCFYGCSGSGNVPALWNYTYGKIPTKNGCFGDVYNATNKAQIDNTWK